MTHHRHARPHPDAARDDADVGGLPDRPTAYEWLRCDADGANCAAIAGAKGNAYVLTKADEGSTIRVTMTATNTTGTGESTPTPTAVGRRRRCRSTVAPPVDQRQRRHRPDADRRARAPGRTTTDTSYAFAWQRCAADGTGCAPIAGATTADLQARPPTTSARRSGDRHRDQPGRHDDRDLGRRRRRSRPPRRPPTRCRPSAAWRRSARSLSATTGTWTGIAANVKTTFWRCTTACAAIQTGTDRTYTLTPADAGYKIRASVTGVGPGGDDDDLRDGHPRPGQVGHRRHRGRRRRARLAEGLHRHRAGEGRGQDPGRRRHRDGHRHAGQDARATGPGPARPPSTTCTKPVKLGTQGRSSSRSPSTPARRSASSSPKEVVFGA